MNISSVRPSSPGSCLRQRQKWMLYRESIEPDAPRGISSLPSTLLGYLLFNTLPEASVLLRTRHWKGWRCQAPAVYSDQGGSVLDRIWPFVSAVLDRKLSGALGSEGGSQQLDV